MKVATPDWVTDSIKSKTLLDVGEYFPTEDAPKTPEPITPKDSIASKKTPTPKLNDGLPSSLLTPVTPTVSQGSAVKMLSPKKPQPNSPLSEGDDIDRKQTVNIGHSIQTEKAIMNTKSAADSTSAVNGSESGECLHFVTSDRQPLLIES